MNNNFERMSPEQEPKDLKESLEILVGKLALHEDPNMEELRLNNPVKYMAVKTYVPEFDNANESLGLNQ